MHEKKSNKLKGTSTLLETCLEAIHMLFWQRICWGFFVYGLKNFCEAEFKSIRISCLVGRFSRKHCIHTWLLFTALWSTAGSQTNIRNLQFGKERHIRELNVTCKKNVEKLAPIPRDQCQQENPYILQWQCCTEMLPRFQNAPRCRQYVIVSECLQGNSHGSFHEAMKEKPKMQWRWSIGDSRVVGHP